MAHLGQQEFCNRVKALLPQFFTQVRAVDFGALDINGSNRDLFEDSEYIGVDLAEGKNVDWVGRCHEFPLEVGELFDTVISTEMLEHDIWWKYSLSYMQQITKGLLLVTCATTGRGEHGTARTSPTDSPHTLGYYKNLTEEDFRSVLDLEEFDKFEFSTNGQYKDLYFWGVKRGVDLPNAE